MTQAPDRTAADDAGSLLEAVLLITSDLDLRGALDRVVQAACTLTGARYGVLGLLDAEGQIADFVIRGIDDETAARIASFPTSRGILGLLVDDPRPLRLADLTQHERSLGFPPGHPPMKSFLGVPVRVEGEVFGNLYLTEKAGGGPFTEQDEVLVEAFAQVAGFVIGSARTHAGSERRYRWLEASIAMSDALEGCSDVAEALAEVAGQLCRVAAAPLAAVVADRDGRTEVVLATDGSGPPDPDLLADVVAGTEPLVDQARRTGRVVLGPRVGGVVTLVAPMRSRLVPGHFLLLAVRDGRARAEGPEIDLVAAYADQAALALDRTQALAERQEHMLVADRDRIARDLHDTVIQRLFATALQLQGLRRSVIREEVKVRLDEAVAELNTTIRDIRSTIFELRQESGVPLTTAIRDLARDYVPVLGFTPFVRIRGPVDAVVPAATAAQLMATLREALSNVVRHAEADACMVEVDAGVDRVDLRVSDNGRGITAPVTESGLRNVRHRALDLGGTFRISAEEPRGTLLEWSVPLTS